MCYSFKTPYSLLIHCDQRALKRTCLNVKCLKGLVVNTVQVEAVSSEKAVRVRVKVLDNQTAIYSQDIEMALGEGAFVVPAILSDSDVITLQVRQRSLVDPN